MMNAETESHDVGRDALRAADQEVGGFDNLAEEGESVDDFLEPGDLVALAAYVRPFLPFVFYFVVEPC